MPHEQTMRRMWIVFSGKHYWIIFACPRPVTGFIQFQSYDLYCRVDILLWKDNELPTELKRNKQAFEECLFSLNLGILLIRIFLAWFSLSPVQTLSWETNHMLTNHIWRGETNFQVSLALPFPHFVFIILLIFVQSEDILFLAEGCRWPSSVLRSFSLSCLQLSYKCQWTWFLEILQSRETLQFVHGASDFPTVINRGFLKSFFISNCHIDCEGIVRPLCQYFSS